MHSKRLQEWAVPFLSLWCVPWETLRLLGLRQMKVGVREPAFKGLDVEISGLFEKLSLNGWKKSSLLQSKFAEVEHNVKFH